MAKRKFVFKGSRGGAPKTEWPFRLKAIVARISEQDEELTGGDIITAAIDEFNEGVELGAYSEVKAPFAYTNDPEDPALVEGTVSLLPKSYRNKHASSVIWGMKERFLTALSDRKHKSHKLACRLQEEYNLEVVELEAEEAEEAAATD